MVDLLIGLSGLYLSASADRTDIFFFVLLCFSYYPYRSYLVERARNGVGGGVCCRCRKKNTGISKGWLVEGEEGICMLCIYECI